MGAFVKGDVVILSLPYTDFSKTKSRPAIILAVPREDEIIVCQVTGRDTRPEYTISIKDEDFVEGELNKTSFARPNHLFTIEPKIIKYKAGKISQAKISAIIETSTEILRDM
ncbi:MAG: type II toxin-antitoxin system PemK/MazF family toxin [Methanosarcinaceae archaeon]